MRKIYVHIKNLKGNPCTITVDFYNFNKYNLRENCMI